MKSKLQKAYEQSGLASNPFALPDAATPGIAAEVSNHKAFFRAAGELHLVAQPVFANPLRHHKIATWAGNWERFKKAYQKHGGDLSVLEFRHGDTLFRVEDAILI